MLRKNLVRLGTRLAEMYGNNEYPLATATGRKIGEIPTINKIQQVQLLMQYRALAAGGGPLPSFQDAEFRCYSQNGEDGILLYLFALIGFTNRRSVEICCGSGIDCNTANLAINHGFEALMMDGREDLLAMGRKFYDRCRDTYQWPPRLVRAWITAENVNGLLKKQGFVGEIDLFSLDMDGVDYWIWKALDVIHPRVVVLEYQDIIGPDRAITVPYDPKFSEARGEHGPDYAGASLGAFVKLGREKGYRLVGCEHYGYNAFFLRNDLGTEHFPEVTVESCFPHPKNRFGMEKRWPKVADRKWVEV